MSKNMSAAVAKASKVTKGVIEFSNDKLIHRLEMQVDRTEPLCIQMSGESFIEALDVGVEANDREFIAELAMIAFVRRNIHWQAAARHADNYIIFARQGNVTLRDMSHAAFLKAAFAILQ